jgi:hypothetical protein
MFLYTCWGRFWVFTFATPSWGSLLQQISPMQVLHKDLCLIILIFGGWGSCAYISSKTFQTCCQGLEVLGFWGCLVYCYCSREVLCGSFPRTCLVLLIFGGWGSCAYVASHMLRRVEGFRVQAFVDVHRPPLLKDCSQWDQLQVLFKDPPHSPNEIITSRCGLCA